MADTAASAQSTLSVLRRLRAESFGFLDFYVRLVKEISEVKQSFGTYYWKFMLLLIVVPVCSFFLIDCQDDPMLPMLFILAGVVYLSIELIERMHGSLLKDDKFALKNVTRWITIPTSIVLISWFIFGIILVVSTPSPDMPLDSQENAMIDVIELVFSLRSANSQLNDQLAVMKDALIALRAPATHCVLPTYGLSAWIVISPLMMVAGYFMIITVTSMAVYVLL